ncbi:MAG: hypothetical protein JWO82_4218, partial [Akkermansiaceae bacterium]|nr:hypothetical protein [Akkermansiaceae bacterium]
MMMKLSPRRRSGPFLALLILGAGGLLLWHGHQDLLEARQAGNALRAKLEALGAQDAAGDSHDGRATPGPRDTAAVGRELAQELLAVTAALREARSQASEPEQELLERQIRLKNDANLLTVDGLKAYIAELQQKGDLTDKEVLFL